MKKIHFQFVIFAIIFALLFSGCATPPEKSLPTGFVPIGDQTVQQILETVKTSWNALYQIALMQARYEMVSNIFWSVLQFLMLALLFLAWKKMVKFFQIELKRGEKEPLLYGIFPLDWETLYDDNGRTRTYVVDDDSKYLAAGILALISLFLGGLGISCLFEDIGNILNYFISPDYMALRIILQLLGK